MIFTGGVELSQSYLDLKLRPATFTAVVCWGGRGAHRTPELPFLPSILTGVTSSLERDLESCWISITYTTESRHKDAEKLDFMWHSFTSAFLAKLEVALQHGRHWESKCSWQSLVGPCSLPRLIPGQGPRWHQQTFHVFTETPGTERSVKIKSSTLRWLQGAEPRHGRAAAALHTVPKDQVT